MAILDFLYFGEANVFQENLDSFLAIAEELKLNGLTGKTSSQVVKVEETGSNPDPIHKTQEPHKISPAHNSKVRNIHDVEEASKVIAVSSNQFSEYLQALDEKVKSMMEKGQNMIQTGKHANGTPRRETAFICNVCGKEAPAHVLRDHIEANHLEGISIPCDYCDKIFSARCNLKMHKSKFHK